jgi:hypothetical protein
MYSSLRKYEGWLYGLAFLIALGFRLIQLGAAPLTDAEATLALQALHIAQGKAPLLGSQPGYVLPTSLLFAVIGSTNFMARALPALAGSVLVFLPHFFKDVLKPRAALLLALLISIDPALVALSRQSGGTMLAVTSLFFAWAMWMNERPISAGILAGFALLAGPSVWAGVVALAITGLLLQRIDTTAPRQAAKDLASSRLRSALISLAVTLLVGGTLFFLAPNGLSAWLSALPDYLVGWTAPSVITPGRVLLAFFAYEILGIFLAALSLIRGYRTGDPRILRLSLWLGVALLLAVFYRQPGELVWAILPLLALAAIEFSRMFHIFPRERVEVGSVAIALMILLVYVWFDIAKIALDPLGQLAATTLPLLGGNIQVPAAPYLILAAALLIILLCIAFGALGWSARTAWLGSSWAFVIFFGLYNLGAAWGASGLRSENGVELWKPDPPPAQADLLAATVRDISEFSVGHDQAQPITIMGIASPALEWVLRDHPVAFVSTLDPQIAPPIVITPIMQDLGLPSAYRGQDFLWKQTPIWEGIQYHDWIRWLVFRQLPRQDEMIVLWARDDLFPDARESIQP